MGSGSRSCIDQTQYVVAVSCFHLFDVMVVYGSLIDKRVDIRGVLPDTMGCTGQTQGDSSETKQDACVKSLIPHSCGGGTTTWKFGKFCCRVVDWLIDNFLLIHILHIDLFCSHVICNMLLGSYC